jgi:carbamoyltransferase
VSGSPYLGSETDQETLGRLSRYGGLPKIQHHPDRICVETAARLAQGKLVGWIQGRAEFGPRALRNRSILADPRSQEMKDIISARVKFRESFRPFAPSILHQHGPASYAQRIGPGASRFMRRTQRFTARGSFGIVCCSGSMTSGQYTRIVMLRLWTSNPT